jgi:hypothetical protein
MFRSFMRELLKGKKPMAAMTVTVVGPNDPLNPNDPSEGLSFLRLRVGDQSLEASGTADDMIAFGEQIATYAHATRNS